MARKEWLRPYEYKAKGVTRGDAAKVSAEVASLESRLEFLRAYQHSDELRLFGVVRNTSNTMFIGTNFADDAVAYLVVGTVLTKLERVSVNHTDWDILVTEPFSAVFPYTLYVVNPNDEAGQASNAIVFDHTDQAPVLDVRVDGESVVQDQIADINLKTKLDRQKKPNMLYGTDDSGNDLMYDADTMMGIQQVWMNGAEVKPVNHIVKLDDIARASLTVPRSSNPAIVYGTDSAGNQITYLYSLFAQSNDMQNAQIAITALQTNKQDKDQTATDGAIAIMRGHQSVGSSVDLANFVQRMQANETSISNLQNTIDQLRQTVTSSVAKDWKAVAGDRAIQNHPVSTTTANITITNATLASEATMRAQSDTVIYAVGPGEIGSNAVAVGSGVSSVGDSVAVGKNASATGNAIAIGEATRTNANGIAIGTSANAAENSIAIGYNASNTAANSVAIGYASVANEANTVSVGVAAGAGQTSQVVRRITNVQDPTKDTDAATKKYVDAKAATGGTPGTGTVTTETIVDKSVTTEKINDGAVTTIKIQNGAVTTEKLGNNSVTTEKIVDKSVTTEKLADGAVSTIKIKDGAVTPAKLAGYTAAANGKIIKVKADGSGFEFVDSAGGTAPTVSQKGIPTYIVASASDTTSVQGETIEKPCILVIPTSNPPQIIYSN